MSEQQRVRDLIARYFGLEAGQIDPVLVEFERVVVHGGDWLFHQGDAGDSLYFLVRGRLRVWVESEEGESNPGPGRALLGEIAPGETVGEIGLLTGENRTAGIQAVRDCLLLRIGRGGFERLVRQYPGLAIRLAGNIAARLHQRTSRKADSARNLVNLCLVPLEQTAKTLRFMDGLAAGLDGFGATLNLAVDDLVRVGAPAAGFDGTNPVPQDLTAWLEEREATSRFVLYRCDPARPHWSAFATRQADLVLLIGDSTTDPGVREWENHLVGAHGAATEKRALVLVHPGPAQAVANTKAWLDGRELDYHLHAFDEDAGSVARICRILAGEAVGLVLGAGAARGFAHIGVYRALSEAGIPVDWVGGASIGAIIGAAVALAWSPDKVRAKAHEAFVLNNPFRDYTLPIVSLLSGRKMMRLITRSMDSIIEDMPIPFFCVSATLDTGTLIVHRSGSLPKALQAAAALPVALPPAVVNKRLVIDGGVINSLPVDVIRRFPVGRVIAVDISTRKAFEVDFDELPSAWTLLRSRWLGLGRRYQVPGLVSILLKSTEVGTLEKMHRLGNEADLLINPPVREFGMTDVKRFDEIVEAGYRAAQLSLKDWDYLGPD